MKTGKVTSRFQLTLPKEFVEELGLEEGQAVLYELEGGKIMVTPLFPAGQSRRAKGKKSKGAG